MHPAHRAVPVQPIPGLGHMLFGDEFYGHSLSVYGPATWTCPTSPAGNARESLRTPQRRAFDELTAGFPDTFSIVVGPDGPAAVWLVLRLDRLNAPIADALLDVRTRTLTALRTAG